MTIEPMSEAELRALQRLSGDAEGRVIHYNFPKREGPYTLSTVDPLAEDWAASSIPYGNWCDPHVPCPCPDSCAADQVCIARCQWLVDTPQNRIALQRLVVMETTPAPANLDHHTVDIDRQPMSVEDELREIDGSWNRWGLLIMFASGIGMGYAFAHWVLPHLVGSR